MKGGKIYLSKVEKAVKTVSCKHGFILAKSTEDFVLDFMSWNRSSNGSRKFEYSIFLGGRQSYDL